MEKNSIVLYGERYVLKTEPQAELVSHPILSFFHLSTFFIILPTNNYILHI